MEENMELGDPIALLIRAKDAGRGSGFFVGKNLIATNIHVVAAATSVSAELVGTKTEFIVEGVAAFDAKNDLVILKIAGEGTPLPLGDSNSVKSGDVVQAVGYPGGKHKVTNGVIHSIRNSDKWIRMKCETLDGNSGGPALNRNSEVVGIAVAVANCLSFAIPVNAIKALLAVSQAMEPLRQWSEREHIQAYACLVQSKIKLAGDHYDDAIVNLDKAIQLNPDYFLFYCSRGSAKICLGQSKVEEGNVVEAQRYYQDAVNDYTEVIKLCPDCAASYSERGVAKSQLGQSKVEEGNVVEAQRHYQDAINDHTEAIKLCLDYDPAYNNRADVKLHFGKSEGKTGNMKAAKDLYQEALIDINTAIKLDSNIALFFHTRGEM